MFKACIVISLGFTIFLGWCIWSLHGVWWAIGGSFLIFPSLLVFSVATWGIADMAEYTSKKMREEGIDKRDRG